MSRTPEYMKRLDAQIEDFKQELKPLEEGIVHLAEARGAAGIWQDTTQRHITRLKAIIDNLVAVRTAMDSDHKG